MKAPLLALALRTAAGLAAWPGLAETTTNRTETAPQTEIRRPAQQKAENRPERIDGPSSTENPSALIVIEKPATASVQYPDAHLTEVQIMPFISEPRHPWRQRIMPGFILRKWSELWINEKCDSGVILVKLEF